MVTSNAAIVAGVDKDNIVSGQLPMGAIGEGYAADFFLAPCLDAPKASVIDPYESLLRTYPKHIDLVFVDGKPVYGDKPKMSELTSAADELSVQNTPKAVVTIGGDSTKLDDQKHLPAIQHSLDGALTETAPFIEN
jgi:hypothetical protein